MVGYRRVERNTKGLRDFFTAGTCRARGSRAELYATWVTRRNYEVPGRPTYKQTAAHLKFALPGFRLRGMQLT